MARRLMAPLSAIFTLAGLLLFAYYLWRTGVGNVAQAVAQLGVGFLLVLLISGVRPAVRSLAWTRCVEGDERLGFGEALQAYLIGDALGNLIPFGIVVSEPTKVVLVRQSLPFVHGLAAITVENLFYSLSVMLFLFAGSLALLFSFALPKFLRLSAIIMPIAILALAIAGFYFSRHDAPLSALFGRFLHERGRERVRDFERRVFDFYRKHGSRAWAILLLEAIYHLSSVLEAYVTLIFVSDAMPTPLKAFAFEAVNRITTVVFKFIPFRIGIDETSTGLLASVLGLGAASGVALAITRKGRILCWTAVGALLLAWRGLSLRELIAETQRATANEAESN